MDLTPLLNAPLAIQIHVATVLLAFVIGGWLIFLSRKGSPGHRALGALYLALMTATAIAAAFIQAAVGPKIGPFGPIHLFVLLTLWGVFNAVRGKCITALYDNDMAFATFGYPGSSWEKGGYITRGFQDLKWLPTPSKEASPPLTG